MHIELTGDDETRVEEFSGNLFMACLATMELANVELGVRLGLYEALAGAGPVTAARLAESAGIAERYAREWLEQQAVAGVIEVDDPAAPAAERRFTLPNAHAHVLMDDDSEACMKPCAAVVPWLAKALDIMVEEFRRGAGAAFGLFDLHDVQAAFTRPVFVNHLTQTWLPALPDVQPRLTGGERVRIAEIGGGEGLAAITIALLHRPRQAEYGRARTDPHARLLAVGEEVVLHRELVVVVPPAPQGHRDQPVQALPAPLPHPRCRGVRRSGLRTRVIQDSWDSVKSVFREVRVVTKALNNDGRW